MQRIESAIPKEIEWADNLASLMDDQFRIPIINVRFGLDPILGLIPWLGDVVSFFISVLIIKSLVDAGMPRKLMAKLTWTIVLDLLVGAVPVVGDIWDFFFKANRKNLNHAKEYFQFHHRA